MYPTGTGGVSHQRRSASSAAWGRQGKNVQVCPLHTAGNPPLSRTRTWLGPAPLQQHIPGNGAWLHGRGGIMGLGWAREHSALAAAEGLHLPHLAAEGGSCPSILLSQRRDWEVWVQLRAHPALPGHCRGWDRVDRSLFPLAAMFWCLPLSASISLAALCPPVLFAVKTTGKPSQCVGSNSAAPGLSSV